MIKSVVHFCTKKLREDSDITYKALSKDQKNNVTFQDLGKIVFRPDTGEKCIKSKMKIFTS